MAIRFSSNTLNPGKLIIHPRAKDWSYFSLCTSPHSLSSHLNVFPLFFSPLFYFSLVVPTKSRIQSLKSSFFSISGHLPLFTEGVCEEHRAGEVIRRELKWNRLFRLRCTLLWNVQRMRKNFKGERCIQDVQLLPDWGHHCETSAVLQLKFALLYPFESETPLFTPTCRAVLSQLLNVKSKNWKAAFQRPSQQITVGFFLPSATQ